MITIDVFNTHCQIVGKMDPDKQVETGYHEALRKEMSYQIVGVDWSPRFKTGEWDGRISLYSRWKQIFPTGLVSRVTQLFDDWEVEYELVDKRLRPGEAYSLTTAFAEAGRSLFPYQEEAVVRAVDRTRGIVAVATGGGKTMIACEMMARMGVGPFVFIVPSISLLRQTHREFEKYLRVDGKPADIGIAGGGRCHLVPGGVNIFTYQTALIALDLAVDEKKGKAAEDPLAGEKIKKLTPVLKAEYSAALALYESARATAEKIAAVNKAPKPGRKTDPVTLAVRREKTALDKAKAAYEARLASEKRKAAVRDILTRAQGFIVDEAHLAAVVTETLAQNMPNAFYRIGVTATPFREDRQEIRIEGAMGRKMIQLSASDLISLGRLVPPRIYMVKVNHLEKTDNWPDTYKKHVVECWPRNFRIKQFAEALKADGRPTLILVNHIQHGKVLEAMVRDSVFVAGSDQGDEDPGDAEYDYRQSMLDACQRNEIILIATSWAYTGVDAQRIGGLIIADAGKSAVTTYQQVGRALRTVGRDYAESVENGKSEAIIIDFWDQQPALHDHSLARWRVYKNEPQFVVKKVA